MSHWPNHYEYLKQNIELYIIPKTKDKTLLLSQLSTEIEKQCELNEDKIILTASDGEFTYNYDDFVAFDKPSWDSSTSSSTRAVDSKTDKFRFNLPLGKPVVKVMKK